MSSLVDEMIAVCLRHGAEYLATPLDAVVGVSSAVGSGLLPLNGLRHRAGSTSGWFLWAGEELGWLAVSVARQIEMENDEVEIIQSGSVFEAGEIITKPMRDIVLEHCPRAKLRRLDGPPAVGAVILGMEQARFDGYAIRDRMVQTANEIVN